MHNKNIELIILVYLLSVFCIPSTLGVYKKSTSTTGVVTVASWDVSLNQTGVNNNVRVVAGDANGTTYTLKVRSDSEVDTAYDVIISNVPSDVEVKFGNRAFQQPINNTVRISNAGTILYSASNKENTHTIVFKASTGATSVNNQTVNIDVDFKQMY